MNANHELTTIQTIQEFVSIKYNVTLKALLSKVRKKEVVFPRHIAMYLSRELTDLSFPKIAEEFKKRDHTTVMHAHEKVSNLIEKDSFLNEEIKEIIKKISFLTCQHDNERGGTL